MQASAQYVFLHQCVVDCISTEPPKPARGLDEITTEFLQKFFVPSKYNFDIGVGGRKIHRIEGATLTDEHWANGQDVMLVLTSDVFLVCMITKNNMYRLCFRPLARSLLSASPTSVSSEVASLTVSVKSLQASSTPSKRSVPRDNKLYFVAKDGNSRRAWEKALNDTSDYTPTDYLRGSRIVGKPTPSRESVLSILGIDDPTKEETIEKLVNEWTNIPKILQPDNNVVPKFVSKIENSKSDTSKKNPLFAASGNMGENVVDMSSSIPLDMNMSTLEASTDDWVPQIYQGEDDDPSRDEGSSQFLPQTDPMHISFKRPRRISQLSLFHDSNQVPRTPEHAQSLSKQPMSFGPQQKLVVMPTSPSDARAAVLGHMPETPSDPRTALLAAVSYSHFLFYRQL